MKERNVQTTILHYVKHVSMHTQKRDREKRSNCNIALCQTRVHEHTGKYREKRTNCSIALCETCVHEHTQGSERVKNIQTAVLHYVKRVSVHRRYALDPTHAVAVGCISLISQLCNRVEVTNLIIIVI